MLQGVHYLFFSFFFFYKEISYYFCSISIYVFHFFSYFQKTNVCEEFNCTLEAGKNCIICEQNRALKESLYADQQKQNDSHDSILQPPSPPLSLQSLRARRTAIFTGKFLLLSLFI